MKKYIVIAAALILSATSCNLLNTSPGSSLGTPDYFKTETDLQLFSNAFYDMINSPYETAYKEQSDHYVNFEMSAFLKGGKNRTVPASGGGWSWGILRRVNNLIMYAPQCEDEALIKKYTALSKFFRAYFYFEKVKTFGDVPWVDTPLGSNDAALYNPRVSREFIVDKMIEDIDEAIAGLPATKTTFRVNKWTALALKAQFCLYEGTLRKYHEVNPSTNKKWSNAYQTSEELLTLAYQAAETIMKEGGYSLYKDYVGLFANVDADNNPEMIMALKFEESLSRKNNSSAFAILSNQGRPGLTKKFVDSFLMKDGTRFTDKEGWATMQFIDEVKDRDPRLGYCTRTAGYKYINTSTVLASDISSSSTGFQLAKYVMDPSAGTKVHTTDGSFNDLPVYRLAEIYLIFAEAKAELGILNQGDLDASVNLIRKRAGMPNMSLASANSNPDWYLLSEDYGYTSPVLASDPNKGVIVEIRRERAVELAQEGHRLDDLIRWKEGKCISQKLYGMYFPGPGAYDLTGDGKPNVVLYTAGNAPAQGQYASNVQLYVIGDKTAGVQLSEVDHGYIDTQKGIDHVFDESRDYLYPIPSGERLLNHDLSQNPNWEDGLSF